MCGAAFCQWKWCYKSKLSDEDGRLSPNSLGKHEVIMQMVGSWEQMGVFVLPKVNSEKPQKFNQTFIKGNKNFLRLKRDV